MRSRPASSSASKRRTMTGVVLDARASPNPSGYSTRSPSSLITSVAPGNEALFCRASIRRCASPSASFRCNSGVLGESGSASSVAVAAAVDLAVELQHLAAQAPVEFARGGAGDAVAAVDCDFHGTREAHIGGDAIEVGLAALGAAVPPGAPGELARFDPRAQPLHILAR